MRSFVTCALIGLAACGSDDAGDIADESSPGAVTLSFSARVGSAEFSCDESFTGLGTTAATTQFSDMRYYVHDVRLVDDTGVATSVELDQDGAWQYEDIALLDFETGSGSCANGSASTNSRVTGTVAAGDYVGVRFKVGIPAEWNHIDVATAPSPLNVIAMSWDWLYGYRFARIDMSPVGAEGYVFHLGSSNCTGDPAIGATVTCERRGIPEIALDQFDVARDTVMLDIAALTADTDVTTSLDSSPGCHSGPADPDCEHMFTRIGLDFATGQATGLQTVFSKL